MALSSVSQSLMSSGDSGSLFAAPLAHVDLVGVGVAVQDVAVAVCSTLPCHWVAMAVAVVWDAAPAVTRASRVAVP